MGVLGPAMVAGSWWESRKSHRGQSEREWQKFDTDSATFAREQEAGRQKLKTEALAGNPELLCALRDPYWRDVPRSEDGVRLGTQLWSPPPGHAFEGQEALPGMPAMIASDRGVAVVGGAEMLGVWRLILANWIIRAHPDERMSLPAGLPHGVTVPRKFRGQSLAVWVSHISDVPMECDSVVMAHGEQHLRVRESHGAPRIVRAESLTGAEFAWVAERLQLPEQTQEGVEHVDYSRRDQLLMDVGDQHPWDLVQQGPHAVVWGSTGSGKSVTVVSLVMSMTEHYSPEHLAVVVIDFKGGAGLAPLASLPHTAGNVSDLDPVRAGRALSGLAREMVMREHLLSTAGVSDIAQLPSTVVCPRLIIAVDEAAWLLGNFPAWSLTLADLVARGRSLGIHVLIATQRVQGVLAPAVMANIALRLCGRISDDAEVTTWMPGVSGTRLQHLRNAAPGHALALGALRSATEVRVEPRDPSRQPAYSTTPWRVWAEELPLSLAYSSEAWGLADDEENRTHRNLTYDPERDGSFLVLGDRGSGRTTALAALASQCNSVVVAPSDPFALLLMLHDMNDDDVCVIDNIDVVLRAAGPEGSLTVVENLVSRSGAVIMSSTTHCPHLRQLSQRADKVLVLSLAKEESSLAWGGRGICPPGRGQYAGLAVQVGQGRALRAAPSGEAALAVEPPWGDSLPIVITHTPGDWALVATHYVGRPEDVMSRWSTLSPLLEELPVLLEGVSSREVLLATGGRVRIPPVPVPEGMIAGWWLGSLFLFSQECWRR